MHKNLVVADALVIEVNSDNEPIILENSAILVQDGIIKEIGPTIELRQKYQTIPEIGGNGMVGSAIIRNIWKNKRFFTWPIHR